MDSSSFVNCPNCNEKYKDVFLFPCTHNFCGKCTDLMKNGAETTCLLCSKSCHQDEVKRNTYVEKFNSIREKPEENENNILICEICGLDDNTINADKYCVECDQFMCEKCSTMHLRTKQCSKHNIVDKNDRINKLFCKKHDKNFTLYCKICDDIICHNCWIEEHSDHAQPGNVEDNLENVFAESATNIKMKISEMDDNIKNQNILIQEHEYCEKNLLEKYDLVLNSIENHTAELKLHIDVIKNAMILQVNSIKNKYKKSVKNNIKEINDYIDLLSINKSYYSKMLNNKSNMHVFYLKRELSKKNCIEYKQAKKIEMTKVTYKKPSIEKMISSEILKSINVDAKEEIIAVIDGSNSACIFNEKVYSHSTYKNDIINIYDNNTKSNNTSIEFKPKVTDKITDVKLLNTQHNLFLYYRLSNKKCTHLLKFQEYDKTFVELKTFEDYCYISSTYQQTLLVTTKSQIIELSANGEEFKNLTFLDEAVNLLSACFTNHQLKDKRYIVTSQNSYPQEYLKSQKCYSYPLYLLDTEGIIIKSYISLNSHLTCTDGEKYIFAYSKSDGIMQVLSIDLQYLHEFKYPNVKSIYYDKQNDKLLLVKDREITYFTYYLGMLLETK